MKILDEFRKREFANIFKELAKIIQFFIQGFTFQNFLEIKKILFLSLPLL